MNVQNLKRELSIAKTKDNPRLLKDRDEQLNTVLGRQADLEVQLESEKGRSKLLAEQVSEVCTLLASKLCHSVGGCCGFGEKRRLVIVSPGHDWTHW